MLWDPADAKYVDFQVAASEPNTFAPARLFLPPRTTASLTLLRLGPCMADIMSCPSPESSMDIITLELGGFGAHGCICGWSRAGRIHVCQRAVRELVKEYHAQCICHQSGSVDPVASLVLRPYVGLMCR